MFFLFVPVTMPSEVISEKSMQRELADSIIRMVPLDEIRILLACGAKVSFQELCSFFILSLYFKTVSGNLRECISIH